MWFPKLIFIAAVCLFLFSCNESKQNSQSPVSRGSEVLVIVDSVLWESPVGDTIRKSFAHILEGLPEAETEFTLIPVFPEYFAKSHQNYRNILILDMKPEIKKSRVEILTNKWSEPQRVFKIKAGSDTAFFHVFGQHAEAIKELFNQNERAYFTIQNAINRNLEAEKTLSENLGVKMVVSADFEIEKEDTDFVWLHTKDSIPGLGIMIYSFPYKDTSQVTTAAVMEMQEKLAARYFGGSKKSISDSARAEYKPLSSKILYKGMYAIETRGVWNTSGIVTGCPFLNYTIVDAPRQRVVVFNAYIFNPGKPYRDYLRQLESIIWEAEFTGRGRR